MARSLLHNRPPIRPGAGTVGGVGEDRRMVTADDVRAVALGLPRTGEHLIRDHVKFRIGKIVYVSISPDETTIGFGFPKEERAALIDSQPDRFLWPKLSDQRFHWINAHMAALDAGEL